MLTLSEIAERESVVLFNSSAVGVGSFIESIYDLQNYKKLDDKLLEQAQESTKQFLEFVVEENTFTVRGCIEEFEKLQKIMECKQKWLYNSTKSAPQEYGVDREKKILFNLVSDRIFNIFKSSKSKIFKPKNESLYSDLCNYLPYLLNTGETPFPLQPKLCELLAAGLYLSIDQECSTAFVVKNKKFMEILSKMGQYSTLSYSETINGKECPVTTPLNFRPHLYHNTNGNCSLQQLNKNEKSAQRVNT